MTSLVALAVVFVAALGATVQGLRFRAGNRRLLGLYRDRNMPNMVRNLPLVAPVIGLGALPLLILVAPYFLGIRLPPSMAALDRLLAIGAGAYLLLGFAVGVWLLYRPPRRLIPHWVESDDRLTGFTPPDPDWFDKLMVGFGMISVAAGILLLVMGVLGGLG